MEEYSRYLESKRVDWDLGRNVEQMWEQMKRTMSDNAREVCSSVRVGEKNSKNVYSNNVVKVAPERMEATRREVLRARDEDAKDRCMEVFKEENRTGC